MLQDLLKGTYPFYFTWRKMDWLFIRANVGFIILKKLIEAPCIYFPFPWTRSRLTFLLSYAILWKHETWKLQTLCFVFPFICLICLMNKKSYRTCFFSPRLPLFWVRVVNMTTKPNIPYQKIFTLVIWKIKIFSWKQIMATQS